MINLSDEFQSNISKYKYEDEYVELYQQTGHINNLSASFKGDYSEVSLNAEGMSLRISSNKVRKMISTQTIKKDSLQNLFIELNRHSKSVRLLDNTSERIISGMSFDYLREVYFMIDTLFKKYDIKHVTTIQERNISKYIYNNYEYDEYMKRDIGIYLFIEYYINDRRYTLADTLLNRSYNELLSNIEESILNYISLNSNKVIPQGKYNIILAPGTTSILFHECCGHLFEASKVKSPLYCVEKYTSVANSKLTVVDDVFHLSKKETYDDEGILKSKTYIIKEGKLINLLTDRYTVAKSDKLSETANCRRESYLSFPEPRMYCTYVENGTDSKEEIFNSVKYGVFIKSLGEAYINHSSGDFETIVEEAYIIKNGQIEDYLYGIKIKDNALNFLQNIKCISDDLKIVPGFCNSNSGVLYVEYGSPTIYVTSVNLQY